MQYQQVEKDETKDLDHDLQRLIFKDMNNHLKLLIKHKSFMRIKSIPLNESDIHGTINDI